MPNPNNKAKMTGDTHLPDTESEFSVEELRNEKDETSAGPGGTSQASGNGDAGKPGRDINQAGFVKGKETKAGSKKTAK